MGEDVQSLLLAPALLVPVFVAALVLAWRRSPRDDPAARARLVRLFLIGVACQCAHTLEEFATGVHVLYPRLLGVDPVPAEAFVGFNAFWVLLWLLAAWGVLRGIRAAWFPVWFFGLGMCLNGILHPVLAIWVGGYFPGLVTSPVVGALGLAITRRLLRLTRPG